MDSNENFKLTIVFKKTFKSNQRVTRGVYYIYVTRGVYLNCNAGRLL
jgi:hypothetical protein